MPEGPELAYSRDRIRQLIGGKVVVDFSVGTTGRYAKGPPEGLGDLQGAIAQFGRPSITEVATKGKFMWWRLTFPGGGDEWFMHCTYGMSGGWYTTSSKHTAFKLRYNGSGVPITRDVQTLFFNDIRHFGTVKFVRGERVHRAKLDTLGPCILTPGLTPEIFAENVLGKPSRTIAEALMDQSAISGVGNYIKAEALYRAGISPWRAVTEISPPEYVKLCGDVLDVGSESYASQGATISTYRTPDGSKGTTQFNFRVYSRKVCPFGHPVTREETPEGRTSHWCMTCQR